MQQKQARICNKNCLNNTRDNLILTAYGTHRANTQAALESSELPPIHKKLSLVRFLATAVGSPVWLLVN